MALPFEGFKVNGIEVGSTPFQCPNRLWALNLRIFHAAMKSEGRMGERIPVEE